MAQATDDKERAQTGRWSQDQMNSLGKSAGSRPLRDRRQVGFPGQRRVVVVDGRRTGLPGWRRIIVGNRRQAGLTGQCLLFNSSYLRREN